MTLVFALLFTATGRGMFFPAMSSRAWGGQPPTRIIHSAQRTAVARPRGGGGAGRSPTLKAGREREREKATIWLKLAAILWSCRSVVDFPGRLLTSRCLWQGELLYSHLAKALEEVDPKVRGRVKEAKARLSWAKALEEVDPKPRGRVKEAKARRSWAKALEEVDPGRGQARHLVCR